MKAGVAVNDAGAMTQAQQINRRAPLQESAPQSQLPSNDSNIVHVTPVTRTKKIDRVEALLRQRSLNLFEASTLGEYTLAETVYKLRAKGIAVVGTPESVANRYGGFTHVVRYRINP